MREADYKWISEEYDSVRPMSRGNLECWMTLISQRIGPRRSVELLDLGCGTGRFSIPMATRLRYTVVGADSSEEMLQKAQEKDSSTKVKWDLQDAAHLSYPDHSFDVVFMSHLLHHVDEPLRVVGECCRILRAGGVILNRYGAIEHIRDDPEHRFFPEIIGIDEVRTPTIGYVEDWFGVAGFKDVSSETIAQRTFESADERLEKAGLKCTSALTLIDQSAFEKGLQTFQRYVSENPDDSWLLIDRITLTHGRKV
ncbi:MAG: class I SAM-dependent methyltransferase [Methanomassiliicoccales archaeon]|nr:MAG: class I SAM-dependent methyltransferase [Methanomassiliicoccales archaeon]